MGTKFGFSSVVAATKRLNMLFVVPAIAGVLTTGLMAYGDNAMAAVQTAVACGPEASAQVGRAETNFLQDELAKAEKMGRRAQSTAPRCRAARWLLARVYQRRMRLAMQMGDAGLVQSSKNACWAQIEPMSRKGSGAPEDVMAVRRACDVE